MVTLVENSRYKKKPLDKKRRLTSCTHNVRILILVILTSKGCKARSDIGSEVLYAINTMKNRKATLIDEIRSKMLELMDIAGVSWLTHVIKVVWQSGRVLKK